MVNFIKGVVGGIGNIVPGLSGSLLLIILDVYESCIKALNEIVKFKNIKKNIIYLIPIALGIIGGTIFFGRIIEFFLYKWPMSTSYAFFGFILGTIPYIFKSANKKGFKKSYIIIFFLTFFTGVIFGILSAFSTLQLSNINFVNQLILGLTLAMSTIIPGISSTVLLTMLGMYDIYLSALAKIDILFFVPVSIGFAIGVIIFTRLISYLLKKYYGYTFYAILGFSLATLPAVLRGSLGVNTVSLVSLIIMFFSYLITYTIFKKRV